MPTDTYLPDTTYQNLIAALLQLTPIALEIECTDRLKMILGETAGIWPDSIRCKEPAGLAEGDCRCNNS